MSGGDDLVERSSPDSVAETVRRLVTTAEARGVTVFATVDHAAGARSVGLDMPETQVVFLGNPRAGTPVMQAVPDLALDLPTRLLVREAPDGTPGSTVVFHDPEHMVRDNMLDPAMIEPLLGLVGLVDAALAHDAPAGALRVTAVPEPDCP